MPICNILSYITYHRLKFKKKKKIANKRLFRKTDFRCKNWGGETVKAA